LSGKAVLFAATIVTLLIASALVAPGTSPSHSKQAAETAPASLSTVGTSTGASIGSTDGVGGALGACHSTVGSQGPSPAPAAAPVSAGGTTGPGPLFNSQVAPYAVLTGPYAYVAGGAALRDAGYGYINLTWPSGTLVAAYLIWSILDNSVPSANASLNGHAFVGTWTAYATPSPCWSPTYIYTFAADVTNYVANGTNDVTGIPSSITTGSNPWGSTENAPLDDGASLIIIYSPSTSAPLHEVTVSTGALPVEGDAPIAQLNYSTTDSTQANTTYIVSDGQLPGNEAYWGGSDIDPNAFHGSDPHQSTAVWSYGNLSDTKTYQVPVVLGSNNTTAQVGALGSNDCLTWIGQVVSVGVAAKKGPYKVTFAEQGLTDGSKWNVTINSVIHTGTVAHDASNIQFSLANASYAYLVGSPPGFLSGSGGNFYVAGGPVFIRVIFHQLLYPINFTETGLPSEQSWWVDLSNTSQSFSENLTSTSPENVSFLEGNASYSFTAGEIGLYVAQPSSGTVELQGSAAAVTITFVPPPLYTVTFAEKGLPAGTQWGGSVESNWGDSYPVTVDPTFSVELPNTTLYADTIYPDAVTGHQTPNYVEFYVTGAPETVNITYLELYTVTLQETGLPAGTEWDAYLTNTTSDLESSSYSETAYLNFSVINGTTYLFTVEPVFAYTAAPSSGPVTVAGANVTEDIVFTAAPTYEVLFTETGLPVGTLWSITLYPPSRIETTTNSTTATLTIDVPNGTFYYYPAARHYLATPTESSFEMEGSEIYANVSFTQLDQVTFEESGLPSGTFWDVYFNYAYVGNYSSTIVQYAPAGDYEFYAYAVGGFEPNVTQGPVDLTSAGAVVQLSFVDPTEPTYAVTFTESGLPSLTNWSVSVDDYAEWTTGTSLRFTEPNGSFDFTASSTTGAIANPASGLVNVSGGPASKTIDFAAGAGAYLVTFTESGLPSGATWYVNITGQTGLRATVSGTSGTTVSVYLANGSYSYAAATSLRGWSTPGGGGFTVAGVPVHEGVPFTSATSARFQVTFTETGLGIGAVWYINVTGAPSLSTTVSSEGGTQLVISLTNGSYSYTATTTARNFTANGGKFTVTGTAQGISVPFGTIGGNHTTATPAPFPWVWAGVGLAVLALFLLLLLLFARRRKQKETPPPPKGGPTTWGSPPPGQSP